MTFNAGSKFTRSELIEGASAAAAGIAAPSLLSIRSALSAYPDRPVKVVVAKTKTVDHAGIEKQ